VRRLLALASPTRNGRGAAAVLALGAVGLMGCGGGAPLLHPARALDAWKVRASGGMSANFVPATLGTDLNAARAETPAVNPSTQAVTYPTDPTYAKGVLIAAVVSPGVAPYAGARAGLGEGFEVGLTYTGRAARADFRHSWSWDRLSLSIGGGMSYIFYGDAQGASLPFIDVDSVQGYGADVPVLIGWESAAGIFMAWVGVRGGFDHAGISDTDQVQFMGGPGELSATRVYGGGLVGVATGFRHIHVALEFDANYQSVSGSFFTMHVSDAGLTLVPAGALWVDF
jgi:hypothetical protein